LLPVPESIMQEGSADMSDTVICTAKTKLMQQCKKQKLFNRRSKETL
jgi:hypothetical protein